ncbi:hypothetical protein DH2020_027237 [Rehmannia glutinosa]|uniref:Pathogen-related protein n=1 Tax=Rehmannia glutinosa TaxID=99300 RepID=A0ABR0VWH1_REHGL
MATEEVESGVKIASEISTQGLSCMMKHKHEWRHGGPPTHDGVNQLFEQGEPKHEWAKGSLEEVVQNAIKSWEMELSQKTRIQDFRTINPDKFKLIVNAKL